MITKEVKESILLGQVEGALAVHDLGPFERVEVLRGINDLANDPWRWGGPIQEILRAVIGVSPVRIPFKSPGGTTQRSA